MDAGNERKFFFSHLFVIYIYIYNNVALLDKTDVYVMLLVYSLFLAEFAVYTRSAVYIVVYID